VRILQIIAAAGLIMACALAAAHAEKRVALVVGNAAYRHAGVPKLANPVSDAQGMRDALKGLGFDVTYGEDLDGSGLRRTIGDFADRVADADVALVYFAGHGATFGDTPYVVPVDAEFASLGRVPYELVAVETLIGELRQAKGVRIVILDACRDNAAEQELKRQSARGGPVMRGLAPMKNPGGLIIAYATQHLSTAADDAGGGSGGSLFSWGTSARHSPFTAALLHNIATPGLDVKDMFYRVGRDVIAATDGKQRPEISVSMYDQYALTPGGKESKPAETPPPGGAVISEAALVWETVKSSPDVAAIDAFLARYGNVPVYGDLARARRGELARNAPKEPARKPPRQPGGDQVALAVEPPRAGTVLTAAQERGLKPKQSFRECADCPEMVVVPAGSFTMGSPGSEPGRVDNEGPQHVVTIRQPFAVGKFHVTRDQFAVFANETGFAAHSGCDWRSPGFTQDGSHPVVCVSWDDAKAYADWLAKKTSKAYRLLSEAEFEYAARAGTTTPFWWGSSITPDQANYDGNYVYAGGGSKGVYRARTVPVDSFQPNPWGLYNVHGNAYQWTADCWHNDYNGAPADGSAWITTCNEGARIVRGGSWYSLPMVLRAALRVRLTAPNLSIGFRVARTLIP
jgi:formylglycine-generating enzyme required for sulfatase activity/uncharacterized caspase-like protein